MALFCRAQPAAGRPLACKASRTRLKRYTPLTCLLIGAHNCPQHTCGLAPAAGQPGGVACNLSARNRLERPSPVGPLESYKLATGTLAAVSTSPLASPWPPLVTWKPTNANQQREQTIATWRLKQQALLLAKRGPKREPKQNDESARVRASATDRRH